MWVFHDTSWPMATPCVDDWTRSGLVSMAQSFMRLSRSLPVDVFVPGVRQNIKSRASAYHPSNAPTVLLKAHDEANWKKSFNCSIETDMK